MALAAEAALFRMLCELQDVQAERAALTTRRTAVESMSDMEAAGFHEAESVACMGDIPEVSLGQEHAERGG